MFFETLEKIVIREKRVVMKTKKKKKRQLFGRIEKKKLYEHNKNILLDLESNCQLVK